MAFDACGTAGTTTRSPIPPFVAHPLLANPHVQTLLPLFAPLPELAVRTERLELPDGDFIDVGWTGEGRGRPTAVLVHGLAGSMRSRYVLRMAARLVEQGWCVGLFQLRGAGGEPNRLAARLSPWRYRRLPLVLPAAALPMHLLRREGEPFPDGTAPREPAPGRAMKPSSAAGPYRPGMPR